MGTDLATHTAINYCMVAYSALLGTSTDFVMNKLTGNGTVFLRMLHFDYTDWNYVNGDFFFLIFAATGFFDSALFSSDLNGVNYL